VTNDSENEIPEELLELLRKANYSEDDIRQIWRLAVPDKPGVRRPGKRGRDTKWTVELNLQLIKEISEFTQGDQQKISAACRDLAEREPWKTFIEVKGENRTIANVLREHFHRLFKGSFSYWQDTETGELHEFVRQKQPKRGPK